jgi:hypothetical protein
MANADRPKGFWPIRKMDGSPYNGNVTKGSVDASNATAFFKGDAITRESDGNYAPAAANDPISGVFQWADYASASQSIRRVNSNTLPATTAGTIYFIESRNMVFGCQADDDTSALTTAAIGANLDHVAGAGDSTRQLSAHELDSSDVKTATAGFRIIALVPRDDNAAITSAGSAPGKLTVASLSSANAAKINADWEVIVNEEEYDGGAGI